MLEPVCCSLSLKYTTTENIGVPVEVHFDEALESGEDVKIIFISELEVPSFAKAASS